MSFGGSDSEGGKISAEQNKQLDSLYSRANRQYLTRTGNKEFYLYPEDERVADRSLNTIAAYADINSRANQGNANVNRASLYDLTTLSGNPQDTLQGIASNTQTNRVLNGFEGDTLAGSIAKGYVGQTLAGDTGRTAGGAASQNYDLDVLSGRYLSPDSNPYLRGTYDNAANALTDNYQRAIAPNTVSQFARAGQTRSAQLFGRQSADQDILGDELRRLATDVYGGQYQFERGQQGASSERLRSTDLADLQRRADAAGLGYAFNRDSLDRREGAADRAFQQNEAALGRRERAADRSFNFAANDYDDLMARVAVGRDQEDYQQRLLDAKRDRFNESRGFEDQELLKLANLLGQPTFIEGGGSSSAGNSGSAITGLLGTLGSAALLSSDRRVKTDVQPLDSRELLAKVGAWTWRYKGSMQRLAGPMAQELEETPLAGAVLEGPGGMKMVDYGAMGFENGRQGGLFLSLLASINERLSKLEDAQS